MQVVLSLLLGSLCCGVVLSFSLPYYARRKFFINFKQFLQEIKINTIFLQDNIQNVINKTNYDSDMFKNLIKYYQIYLKTKEEQGFLDEINKMNALNSNDKTQIGQFFLGLGHCDSDTQNEATNSVFKYVDVRLGQINNDIQSKAVIIQKLAIILGLVIFILLL